MNIKDGDRFYVNILSIEAGLFGFGVVEGEMISAEDIEPVLSDASDDLDPFRVIENLKAGRDELADADVCHIVIYTYAADMELLSELEHTWVIIQLAKYSFQNKMAFIYDLDDASFRIYSIVGIDDAEDKTDFLESLFDFSDMAASHMELSTKANHNLASVHVLDVGQALCVEILDQAEATCGFFDFGLPLGRKHPYKDSVYVAERLSHIPDDLSVVLSHWHIDHVSMISFFGDYLHRIHWYVPSSGTPSSLKLMNMIKDPARDNVTVLAQSAILEIDTGFRIGRCDREGSKHAHDHGLFAELVLANDVRVLLSGDTSYDLMKERLIYKPYNILQVCHHGGTFAGCLGVGSADDIPDCNSAGSIAVYSHGMGNRYGHPNRAIMEMHAEQGWTNIHKTAFDGRYVFSPESLQLHDGIPYGASDDLNILCVRGASGQEGDIPENSLYHYIANLLGDSKVKIDLFKTLLIDEKSAASNVDVFLGIRTNQVELSTLEQGRYIKITEKLFSEIDKIKIYYSDDKEHYRFEFQGALSMQDTNAAIVITYTYTGLCVIELDADNTGIQISSLASIADLFGISDLSRTLPEKLDALKNFELADFKIEMDADFSKVYSFNIGLRYAKSWELPGFETLCSVGNPELEFSVAFAEQNIYMVELSGDMQMGSFEVELSGAWKSNREGFVLSGALMDKEVDLCDFLSEMISFLGFQELNLPFPHINLSIACINFDTSNSALDFNIGMAYGQENKDQDGSILNKLLGISSYIDVHSTVSNGGKRTFSGHFEGWLHIKEQMFTVIYEFRESGGNEITASWKSDGTGLSLIDIVAFFGVKDAEEVLSPLNIVCQSVSLQFDIAKKEMTLSVDSNYGDLTCRIREDDSDGTAYMVSLAFKDSLTLSRLPFANEVGDLSDIGIDNLSLTISNGKWDSIGSGITLAGNAFCGDTTEPFEWCSNDTPDNTKQDKLLTASANIPVNWNIGAVNVRSIIPGYESGQIKFGADISFHLGMLEVSFENLKLTYNISDKMPGIGLDGLGISGHSASIDLEGSLLHTTNETYTGALNVQCVKWGLQAIASYTAGENNSLFAFGMLRGMLGGAPCFMLTGIGAGLGFSRELSVPDIDHLNDFALVGLATGKTEIETIVGKVDDEFKPVQGSKWLAAGITANSFRMVDILLLLTAQLEKNPVFNLLGRADVSVPFDGKPPVAHAGLIMKVSVDPVSGYVPIDGILSNDSYVLSEACHLSGGFAFYTWYSGEHAGDFVISMGGYRNSYSKPAHYPAPQRLQMSWRLSDNLSAEGSLYFALTPSCVMAGGDLAMNFAWKCVTADFHAYVDILMCWKPYSYDFDIGISLKVQAKLKIFKIKLELGCDLAIWGPKFTGIAKIHLWIISFSISFGDGTKGNKIISVDDFRNDFLSIGEEQTDALTEAGKFCAPIVHFTGGVISEQETKEGKFKTVSGEKLEIQIDARIPVAKAVFNDSNNSDSQSISTDEIPICLRPCSDDNSVLAAPELQVKITRTDGAVMEEQWLTVPVNGNFPAALWAEKSYTDETVEHTAGLMISLQERNSFRRLSFVETNREEGKQCSIAAPTALVAQQYDQSKAYDQVNEVKNLSEKIRGLFPEFSAEIVNTSGFADSRQIFNEAPALQSIGGKL